MKRSLGGKSSPRRDATKGRKGVWRPSVCSVCQPSASFEEAVGLAEGGGASNDGEAVEVMNADSTLQKLGSESKEREEPGIRETRRSGEGSLHPAANAMAEIGALSPLRGKVRAKRKKTASPEMMMMTSHFSSCNT